MTRKTTLKKIVSKYHGEGGLMSNVPRLSQGAQHVFATKPTQLIQGGRGGPSVLGFMKNPRKPLDRIHSGIKAFIRSN